MIHIYNFILTLEWWYLKIYNICRYNNSEKHAVFSSPEDLTVKLMALKTILEFWVSMQIPFIFFSCESVSQKPENLVICPHKLLVLECFNFFFFFFHLFVLLKKVTYCPKCDSIPLKYKKLETGNSSFQINNEKKRTLYTYPLSLYI